MNANRHAPKDVLRPIPVFPSRPIQVRQDASARGACVQHPVQVLRKKIRLRQRIPAGHHEQGPDAVGSRGARRGLRGTERPISVIGIAGPGDPLANEATFETLSALRWASRI